MATTRRRYTAEFKREAVRLAQQPEVSRTQVARELERLRRELRRVTMERDIFKKGGCLLREGTLVK